MQIFDKISDHFYIPHIHGGMYYIDGFRPGFYIKDRAITRFVDVGTPSTPYYNDIKKHIDMQRRQRQFTKAIEFKTVPVVCDNIKIDNNEIQVNRKIWRVGRVGEFVRKKI